MINNIQSETFRKNDLMIDYINNKIFRKKYMMFIMQAEFYNNKHLI